MYCCGIFCIFIDVVAVPTEDSIVSNSGKLASNYTRANGGWQECRGDCLDYDYEERLWQS